MNETINWSTILSKYISYYECEHVVNLSFSPCLMPKADTELKKEIKYDLFLLFNYTSYKDLVSKFEASRKHSIEYSLFIVNNLVPIKTTEQKKSTHWFKKVLSQLFSLTKKNKQAFKFLFYLYKNNYSLCTVHNQKDVFSMIWKSSIQFSYQFDNNFLKNLSIADMEQYAWIYFPVRYGCSHHYIGLDIDSYLYKTGQEHKKIFKG